MVLNGLHVFAKAVIVLQCLVAVTALCLWQSLTRHRQWSMLGVLFSINTMCAVQVTAPRFGQDHKSWCNLTESMIKTPDSKHLRAFHLGSNADDQALFLSLCGLFSLAYTVSKNASIFFGKVTVGWKKAVCIPAGAIWQRVNYGRWYPTHKRCNEILCNIDNSAWMFSLQDNKENAHVLSNPLSLLPCDQCKHCRPILEADRKRQGGRRPQQCLRLQPGKKAKYLQWAWGDSNSLTGYAGCPEWNNLTFHAV